MNILFDILIVLIVLLSALVGKKRGFIKTFFGFFESVLSFVIASFLARPIGSFLCDRFLEPAILKYFVRAFLKTSGEISSEISFDTLSKASQEFLLRFRIDGEIFNSFFSKAGESVSESLENVFMVIAEPISKSISYAIAFFALFIVISFLLRIVIKLADLVSKLPFLNFSNHFLGLVAGLLWGIVLAFAFSYLVVLIEPFLQSTEIFRNYSTEDTVILKLLSGFHFLSFFETF